MDLIVEHQQINVDCVEYVLHGTVDWPIWSSEKNIVSPVDQKAGDDWIVVDIQIVHGETNRRPGWSMANWSQILSKKV